MTCMCIWDYICKEYRENCGENLHDTYLKIHRWFRIGLATELECKRACEQAYDRLRTIYK